MNEWPEALIQAPNEQGPELVIPLKHGLLAG